MDEKSLNINEIFPKINDIKNEHYRKLVVDIWEEMWQKSKWEDIYALPVAPTIKYSQVTHNNAVAEMALSVSEVFEKFHNVDVDRDILLTAVLLRDVSKLIESEPADNGETITSKLGEIYPHAFLGAQMAVQYGVPDKISEIILNHTPQSAVFPKSIEGKIVYYVDQLDVIAIYRDRWEKDLKVGINN